MRALKIIGLALVGLRRSPLRVTLTTLGVTFATGALVTMVALAVGVQKQVETPFRALALLNNIQVKPGDTKGPNKSPPLNDDALASLEKIPGVTSAYPDAHVKGIKIHYGDKEAKAIGLAMPREATLLGVADELMLAGRLFEEGDSPEAILGVKLAGDLGFKEPKDAIGKQITVEAAGLMSEGGSKFSYQNKVLTVTVVGVYHAPAVMPESAQQGIFLPVELMKQIPGVYFESAISQLQAGGSPNAACYASITVRVRDPSLLDGVQKEIRGMGYRTEAILSKLHDMRRFFLAIQLLLTVVGSIALSIAALGIVNTLLMAVLERFQEIGLCKAIGASDGDLFVLFLTEAAIIGFLGGLSGILLGWLMSCGMEAIATGYAHRHDISGNLNLFAFPLWLLAASLGFAVGVSVVAGIYPALRAARVDPIRALRSH
jgi:putative ABC transport system permease protein